MLGPLSATCTLVALLTAGEPATAPRHPSLTARADSAAEAMILDEMRAFYRDLDDGNWAALLDHFLPAKVTARWVPPVASREWARLEAPPPTPDGSASASDHCVPRTAVAVVGDWARLLARRCSAPVDEAWFFRMSGHWKIVHLGR